MSNTQRVLVPGGNDLITTPRIGRETFNHMSPRRLIPIGKSKFVYRMDCQWDDRYNTISLIHGQIKIHNLRG